VDAAAVQVEPRPPQRCNGYHRCSNRTSGLRKHCIIYANARCCGLNRNTCEYLETHFTPWEAHSLFSPQPSLLELLNALIPLWLVHVHHHCQNAPYAEIDFTTVEEAHKRTTWEENRFNGISKQDFAIGDIQQAWLVLRGSRAESAFRLSMG
jgi:hypothetical protein